jgi:hypothetical protein
MAGMADWIYAEDKEGIRRDKGHLLLAPTISYLVERRTRVLGWRYRRLA